MILKIVLWPSPTLKLKSELVSVFDNELDTLANNMIETMGQAKGLGLAAIQVGVPKAVFVIRDAIDLSSYVFVNPRILQNYGSPRPMLEGCLSLPGVVEKVKRYPEIVVEAQDVSGKRFAMHLGDPDNAVQQKEAQCFQHELEHLEGKIYVQNLPQHKKAELLKKLAKYRGRG